MLVLYRQGVLIVDDIVQVNIIQGVLEVVIIVQVDLEVVNIVQGVPQVVNILKGVLEVVNTVSSMKPCTFYRVYHVFITWIQYFSVNWFLFALTVP